MLALPRINVYIFDTETQASAEGGVDVRALKNNLMQKLRSQMWQKLADKESKLAEVSSGARCHNEPKLCSRRARGRGVR